MTLSTAMHLLTSDNEKLKSVERKVSKDIKKGYISEVDKAGEIDKEMKRLNLTSFFSLDKTLRWQILCGLINRTAQKVRVLIICSSYFFNRPYSIVLLCHY